EMSIDDTPELFEQAMETHGGLEPLAIRYYETLAEMVATLRPEVVGHFDVVRKIGRHYGDVATPRIRNAAAVALNVVRQQGSILDLNTAGYRKGLETPYPDAWIVKRACDMGIPFALGDDSHGAQDVGAGLEQGRAYLRENGVKTVTVLNRNENHIERRSVPL
ncbi:MAG: histidinol-phosphatase HisJ family protein, partial [Candidatus Hydrogenedentota bacterium]